MDAWEKAKQYLIERFGNEDCVGGSPEDLAAESGFSVLEIEQALASLVDEHRVRPFQDDEGALGYQWQGTEGG